MEHSGNNLSESQVVPKLQFYRYFLGCRPQPHQMPAFERVVRDAGQRAQLDLLHLTLCVIAEVAEPDRFVLSRVGTALAGQRLHSFPVRLSRILGGARGAFARTYGRQDEIQDFYRALVRSLAAVGIEPMHRQSGLRPHVTLGHAACDFKRRPMALEWVPAELLLIESEVGLARHNVLGRWPLLPPRQPCLPLEPAPHDWRLAS